MRTTILVLGALMAVLMFAMVGAGAALADTVFSTSDSPTTKEDCKNGGYAKYGFKNQGECIKAVKQATPADTTAPVVTFTQGPAHQLETQEDAFTFAWEANEPITSLCSLSYKSPEVIANGGSPVYLENNIPCQSPKALSNLEEGEYHFLVRGTDQAGNEGFADRTWRVDKTAPTVNPRAGVVVGEPAGQFQDGATISAPPEQGATVTFDPIVLPPDAGGSPNITLECRTDAAVVGPLVNQWVDCANENIWRLEGLQAGQYTYDIRATDIAGNASVTTVHFTVDTTTP